VVVRKCQVCSNETHDLTECQAPPVMKAAPWSPGSPKPLAIKPPDNRPQFVLKPGTEEYYEAFRIRFDELAGDPRKRGNLSAKDAMLKEGWVIEFESESLPVVVVEQEEVKGTELTLEQVIEKMKEESK